MKQVRFQIAAAFSLLIYVVSLNGQPVAVHPQETDEILGNPGMGWQTFGRTSRKDKSLPQWIVSTVRYERWGWGELEPQPGKLNTDFLDNVLKETRESGQKLALRVMCCSTYKGRPYHPAWIKEIGGKELLATYNDTPFPIPDLDDPIVLDKHLDFIKRLGERYDGHADIDHVDLGSVGWWGEWHLSGSKIVKINSLESRKKIVDAYFAAFKKTPLLMLIGGGECLKYAVQKGGGWRADCLGDLGGFSKNWCHMRKGYPTWIKEAGIEDTWKSAPVAWESCWDMRKWVQEGWSLRYIFNYALACHASYLNNKSAPLPGGENVRFELERFLRRLGYRLVLNEFSHPATIKAGDTLPIHMKWQNTGSAPCYRPYRLAYRLANGDTVKVLGSEVTVNHWMPGSLPLFTPEFMKEPPDLPKGSVNEVSDAPKIPADLPAGVYMLSVGIVAEVADRPIVRLAIKGRDNDGWYPLSKVEVRR